MSSISSAVVRAFTDATPFDIVIATRNRAEALRLSLPLLVAQSHPPQRIIVIDSSDDPGPAYQATEAIMGQGIPVRFEHGPKGSSVQRNRGLSFVTAPVVFFPDDDSLCHPGTTEAMMRVYARDTDCQIAGVCAADALDMPAHRGVSYDMRADHRRHARAMSLRNRVERRVTDLNPFLTLGQMLQQDCPVPSWLPEEQAVRVEWMTGFRMSFRTEAIAAGFEEAFRGYGLYEDIDASFHATRHGALVGANRARIHHHRFPSGRPDAHNFALMTVLNRAFVVARHSAGMSTDERRMMRRKTRNYALARMAMLLPKIAGHNARAGLRGTRAALSAIDALMLAPPEALVSTYATIRDRLLTG